MVTNQTLLTPENSSHALHAVSHRVDAAAPGPVRRPQTALPSQQCLPITQPRGLRPHTLCGQQSPATWPRQAWGHLLPSPSSGSGAPTSRGEAVPRSGPSPDPPLPPAQPRRRHGHSHHAHRAGCGHSALAGGSASEETAYVTAPSLPPAPRFPMRSPRVRSRVGRFPSSSARPNAKWSPAPKTRSSS